MRNLKINLVSTVALLFSTVAATGGGDFFQANLGSPLAYHKVRLLDYNEAGAGTWLFRTNLPSANGTFMYDTLLKFMQQRSEEANITFPDYTKEQVKIVDINLMNTAEYFDTKIETDFFNANPDKGLFFNWPIVGSIISPNMLSEAERIKEVAALNISIDNLPTLIPKIRSTLSNSVPPTTPTFLFFHCEAGSDRTGQVAGSYMMQYKGYTARQAFEWDNEVAGRTIYTMS